MDIHTLSTSMINQATAAVGAQGTLQVQSANADNASTTSGGDSVKISDEARTKATASAPATPSEASSSAQGTTDTLARRVAKLQKQLQQEQGASESPEDKAGHLSTLRAQIRQLQSQQQQQSGGNTVRDAATAFRITHV